MNDSSRGTLASVISFPAGEPADFKSGLAQCGSIVMWARDRPGVTVVTKVGDDRFSYRLPHDLTRLLKRSGGTAALSERQPA